jgi:MoaA/NifB/PqqE/SkfB family radical SAM enzyme
MESKSETPTEAPRQIATWVRADKSRPYCARPWKQVAVLSDGTAVCACIDDGKTNPLGNLAKTPFEEVWNGPAFRKLRTDIAEDIDRTPICRGCPNRIAEPPPEGYVDGVPKPRVLFIESYAGCNLVCPGCDRTAIEGTRWDLSMSWETYVKVIDDLSPGLQYMEFHIGGENWMHRRAADMVRYCRDKNPGCIILSSTNGHFFHTDERARDAVECGIDCFIFSIDGARQESYEKYRVKGKLERAYDGMRRVLAARRAAGRDRPLVVWRYILFPWNDSDEEMQLARDTAKEIGVDHLCWHLNAAQEQFSSKRWHVGSPNLVAIEHELWDTLPARVGWKLDLGFDRYR